MALVVSRKIRRVFSILRRRKSSTASVSSVSSGWDSYSDSDDEYNADNALPPDVPQGCFAVYVGNDKQRFVIGTSFLKNPLFQALLDKAEEEYGFDYKGALVIPCEAVLFEHVCWLLKNNDPTAADLEMEELLRFYSS